MNFPNNFIWGAGSSAYQTEGAWNIDGKGASIWDVFSHQENTINLQETGDQATQGYYLWQQDIQAMKQIGIQSYRFSISWPRVDPKGDGQWNLQGLQYYTELVDALLSNDILPCITLYHWDLPQALQEQGGWLSETTALAFARYAEKIATVFKGKVKRYITLNEVQCVVQLGLGKGIHAPGLCLSNEEQFVAWENLIYAHCLATSKIKSVCYENIVALATTGRICYPVSEQETDVSAARRAMFDTFDEDWTFTHHMLCDILCKGQWPDVQHLKLQHYIHQIPTHHLAVYPQGKPDELWLNVYNGNAIAAKGAGYAYVKREAGFPRTALKWPITPLCMQWGVQFLYERYHLPIIISENGLSCNDVVYLDGKVHDLDRIDFLTRYLTSLQKAIQNGVPIYGYYHWSLTDNFEWHNGYSERFGLVYIDYSNQKRILKDSAYWYQSLIKNQKNWDTEEDITV